MKRIAGISDRYVENISRATPRGEDCGHDAAVELGGPAHSSKCSAVDADWYLGGIVGFASCIFRTRARELRLSQTNCFVKFEYIRVVDQQRAS